MPERLQKLMAQAGIASRREAETYLIAGRVMVNGLAAKLGDKADLAVDDVRIDGEPLRPQTIHTYIMVNKPMQVVTAVTRQYQEKRQLVRDLVPMTGRLFPVGRLDADSEGLVLLTDDGDLAEKMTHPRYEHPKVYEVTVRGELSSEQLAMWQRGVVLDDGPTLPAEVRVVDHEPGATRLKIVMREGRKRQIRRIAVMLGHPVTRLVRTQIGPLALGNLRSGEWRELSKDEVAALRQEAGQPARKVRRRSYIPNARPAATTPPSEYRGENRTSSRNSSRPDSRTDSRPENRSENRSEARPAEPAAGHRSNPSRPSRTKIKRPFDPSRAQEAKEAAAAASVSDRPRAARSGRSSRSPHAAAASGSVTGPDERLDTEANTSQPRAKSQSRPPSKAHSKPGVRQKPGSRPGKPSGKSSARPSARPAKGKSSKTSIKPTK